VNKLIPPVIDANAGLSHAESELRLLDAAQSYGLNAEGVRFALLFADTGNALDAVSLMGCEEADQSSEVYRLCTPGMEAFLADYSLTLIPIEIAQHIAKRCGNNSLYRIVH